MGLEIDAIWLSVYKVLDIMAEQYSERATPDPIRCYKWYCSNCGNGSNSQDEVCFNCGAAMAVEDK